MVEKMTRARATALLAAGTFGAAVRPSAAQAPLTLRIGTLQGDSYAEPFYAADGGFFAKIGINAEFTVNTNGNQLVQAIVGNSLDVAVVDPINLAHPVNAGVPFAFFAGGGLYSSDAPTTVIVVAKNSPLRTAKDLEGKTIGVPGLATISALGAQEWLRKSGADLERVSLVEIPLSAAAAALGRGTIAASVLVEPYLTVSRNDVRVFGKCFDALARSFYINCWFAPRAWIGANGDLIRRLTRAIYDTANWANTHHSETAAIVSKYFKLDEQTVRDMTRVRFSTQLEARLIQPLLDAAHDFKQLDKINAESLIVRV
jgi:NitT/TauT family transport system substrate-binding protein